MKIRRKLYSDDRGEIAYEIDYWQDVSRDQQTNIIVELQKVDFGGPMWCRTEGEFVESSESCGNNNYCQNYDPCNGKNGRCRKLINGLIGTGKKFTVFPDGRVEKYEK